MSTSKHINKICIAGVALMLALTLVFMCGGALGITASAKTLKYESTIFDTSYVHSIDIVMDDWDSFIANCENEEYAVCTVVIDGKKHSNIAIRAKGNTSLSSVRSSGSQRYSFKLEFDQYQDGKSLDGLDKLCLNNLIQDNTMMKDYLVYQLMSDFGADSPLCSFAYLTVNGKDWGLYLAVEGVEDSFLARNYGSDTGELYKPDSLSFGGGRGNGKDFNFDDLDFDFGFNSGSKDSDGSGSNDSITPSVPDQGSSDQGNMGSFNPGDMGNINPGEMSGFPQGGQGSFNPGDMSGFPQGGQGSINPGDMSGFPQGGQGSFNPGDMSGFPQGGQGSFSPDGQGGFSPGSQFPGMPGGNSDGSGQTPDPSQSGSGSQSGSQSQSGSRPGNIPGGMGGFGGMGSDDVKLKYIDDDPDSYSNIFDSAKTDITAADKTRLIESLKKLSSYTDLEDALDMDEVLRYFVVHVFVCNGDSYTGSMIHNYYLHESDGKLGMIPWDYNLAFGTFQGGNASSSVNASIDSPVSGSLDDRPMVGWIFSDETYTEQYHKLFAEFIEKWFTNGELEKLIDDTAEMLRPYVEKDPSKFCTVEEFETGVKTLKQFVTLRAEAVSRQLNGDSTAVETGDLNLSTMGSMGGGKGGNMGGMTRPGSSSDKDGSGQDGQNSAGTPSVPGQNAQPGQDKSGSQSGQMPGGSQGNFPSRPGSNSSESGSQSGESSAETSESSESGRKSGQSQSRPGSSSSRPDGTGSNSSSFLGGSSFPGGGSGSTKNLSSSASFWILTGVSVIILAAGLIIVIKKKV